MVAFSTLAATLGAFAAVNAAPSLWARQSSPPACALTCATSAASNSTCGSISNLACLCNNEAFFDAAGTCSIETCPSNEISAAQQSFNQICNGFATTTFSLNTATITPSGSGSHSTALVNVTSSNPGGPLSTATAKTTLPPIPVPTVSLNHTSTAPAGSNSSMTPTGSPSGASSASTPAASTTSTKSGAGTQFALGNKHAVAASVGLMVAGLFVGAL